MIFWTQNINDNKYEHTATSDTLEKDAVERRAVESYSDTNRCFDLSEQSFSEEGFSIESPLAVEQVVSIDQNVELEEVVLHLNEPLSASLESVVIGPEKSFLERCVSYVKGCLTKENLLIAANLAGQAAAVGSFIGLILAA